MIYYDNTNLATNGKLEELHAFAERVGIKRGYFVAVERHPHYDVPKKLHNAVVCEWDVQVVDRKTLLRECFQKETWR